MAGQIRQRLTYANVMATLAVFLALGGGAFAAVSGIPGAGGVIDGCYQKAKGNLRVIKSNKKCRKSEKAVSWNEKGLKGDTGQTGGAGQAGASGQTGATGQTGAVGPTEAVSAGNVSNPFGSPNGGDAISETLTTTKAGNLLILARGKIGVTCTAPVAVVGIYIDGNVVPFSAAVLDQSNGTSQTITLFGVASSVSLGAHAIKVRADCPGGSYTNLNTYATSVTAVVIGN